MNEVYESTGGLASVLHGLAESAARTWNSVERDRSRWRCQHNWLNCPLCPSA